MVNSGLNGYLTNIISKKVIIVVAAEDNDLIFFRISGEREGAVIPLNSLRGYTDPLAPGVSPVTVFGKCCLQTLVCHSSIVV